MKLLYTSVTFWLLVNMLVWGVGSSALADHGPLETANRFPLHLMFLTPEPVKAQLPLKGEIEATLAMEHSNTSFMYRNNRWDVLIDAGITTLDFSLAYGISRRWAVRLDLPVVSMNDGFLDGFLGSFHKAIGVGDYGREHRPKNSLSYRVRKAGQLWIDVNSASSQLTHVIASTQFAMVTASKDYGLISSLLFRVKVPVGYKALGFGSGALDWGFYFPTQWSGKHWSFYVMPGMAIIGNLNTREADVTVRPSYALFGGISYDYNEHWTWLGQLTYYSSPLEQTGIPELDNGTLLLDLGFYYQIKPGWVVEFAFTEDLTLAAPDFNLRLGLQWKHIF